MSKVKLKKLKKGKPNEDLYQYINFSLFGNDKKDLILALNESNKKFTSMSHFMRCAVNKQLKAIRSNFKVSES